MQQGRLQKQHTAMCLLCTKPPQGGSQARCHLVLTGAPHAEASPTQHAVGRRGRGQDTGPSSFSTAGWRWSAQVRSYHDLLSRMKSPRESRWGQC